MKFPTPIFRVDAHALVMINFLSDRLGLYSFRVRVASSVLSKKSRKCAKPLDYVNLSYDFFSHIPLRHIGWSIAPMQLRREIQALLSVLSEKNIRVMLEIGTASGETLFSFTRVADSNAKIISLDLPHGKFGGGYENCKIPFFTNFAQKNQRIFLLRADSHSPSSLLMVRSILKEQQLDFLFMDGDHTYEGVRKDFQMHSPLVRKGGLIAFHDVCRGPPVDVGDVNKFWNEIKHSYVHQEIIDDYDQKGFGIGVLYT